MTLTLMGWAARAAAAVWAGWWTFFTAAEAIHEAAAALGAHGCMVALMWFAVALAWKYPVAGGAALVAQGCFVIACFAFGWLNPRSPYLWFVIWTLAAPPIVAGLIFLASGGRRLAPA